MICRLGLGLLCLLILACAGCPSESDRVAQIAQQAAHEQAQQNERMMQVQHEVAEAHKRMVEEQAKARTETIALQRDIQKAQVEVGVQRDSLEAERREIAAQRGRDPIIAAAIQSVGVILACLLPLLACIYILRALRDSSDHDGAVAEILIEDLTSARPTLLPPPLPVAALRHEADPDASDHVSLDS